MNKKYLIPALIMISLGTLYKQSLQTMQQGATPSDSTNQQSIIFISSDGQEFLVNRDAAMRLDYAKDNIETAQMLGESTEKFTVKLPMATGNQFELLASIINDLPNTTNLDNFVIQKLRDVSIDQLRDIFLAADFLDNKLGKSIARLFIFRKLQGNPQITYEEVGDSLNINAEKIKKDFDIVQNSAGLKAKIERFRLPTNTGIITFITVDLSKENIQSVYGLSLVPSIEEVKTLDLSSNQLAELPSDAFYGLTNLQSLTLNNNQLKELAEDIFSYLKNLVQLSLDDNRLETLPQGIFSHLTQLGALYLRNNGLKELPKDIFSSLITLHTLYLDENKLKELPGGIFSSLIKLQVLSLSRNQLKELPRDIFSSLTKLSQLYLFRNQLKELPEGIFSSLTALRQLGLSNNPLALTEEQIKQQYLPANTNPMIL